MKILGIETSCDETAAAVVEDGRILSQVIASQVEHGAYQGVVPELASRAHLENLQWVVRKALEDSGSEGSSIDAVAFTRGPGLAGALLMGKVAACVLAYAWKKPCLGVNHLEGHILAAEFSSPLKYPLLALVVSGGHTDLVLVRRPGRYQVLGRTRDDAAGEAFDKVAKLLNLGYPGGPVIDKLARKGNPRAVAFPRPYLDGSWDFSFSGLKTAVLYHLRGTKNLAARDSVSGAGISSPITDHPSPITFVQDICASFQEAVVETLVEKTMKAAKKFKVRQVAVGGGVAANSRLRQALCERAGRENLELILPSPKECTDNAAMIAQAAWHRLKARPRGNFKSTLKVDPGLAFENWS